MIHKIGLAVLCATGLFSSSAACATEHTFSQAAAYEFTLPSNEPQIFTNNFFGTISAKCTVMSESEDNPFSFTILRKSGSLNGIELSKGDSMKLVVHPGDQLYISAASGARVELINSGDKAMSASCTSR